MYRRILVLYPLHFKEIPISLRKTEKRPVSQRKTKDHAKRKADTIERKLKKTKRVHEQRTHWDELQKKGITVVVKFSPPLNFTGLSWTGPLW